MIISINFANMNIKSIFKIISLSVAFIIFNHTSLFSQKKYNKVSRLKGDIEVLSSDSLEGRATGSVGEKKAADYLIRRMTAMGIKAMGENGSWKQAFSFKPHPPVQMHQVGDSVKMGMALVKEITGHNVIGYIDRKASKTIVIGAHYDHLGFGDENSLWSGEKAIHNGADDNASGVAAMLELARRIQLNPKKYGDNNFLFIAFSGEEKGLWGSNYFCKHPTIPAESISCMINMDMVGRLNAEKVLAINGVGTSPIWMEKLPAIQVDGIKIVTSESGVGPSDHTSFYNTGIPALHFFTGQHGDYHKPTDDASLINFEGVTSVSNYIDQLLLSIASAPKLTFTKTKDESQTAAADFKVTLGVVPDYLYDGEGMRIDGTREGRPAAKAGLVQGDVVIKIGDFEVKDMMSYMEALGKFQKGETSELQFIRGGEKKTVSVLWD